MRTYKRMGRVPAGSVTGTAAMIGSGWVWFAADPGSGVVVPAVQTLVLGALFVLGVRRPGVKVAVVQAFQRWTLNPLMRAMLAIGVNPLGVTVLETRGRVTGLPRRTPVGDGRRGDEVWIVAEHGMRANYVRNIVADPRVRIRVRRGLRYGWVDGVATLLPDDDPLARQRQVARWRPLRCLNAMTVRVLGADLLTVHVRLLPVA